MTDERETKGCGYYTECLFEDHTRFGDSYCTLTDKELPTEITHEPPDWCPLRKGPVLVTLKLRS